METSQITHRSTTYTDVCGAWGEIGLSALFAGLSLIKRNWRDERDSGQGFDVFMEYCIMVAGGKEEC
ncbi:hypothetical protein N7489_005260 [Penicillium chrysogenum]|uniref:uncharacterized protein n=1 Tax=Penicillium chrysogenum TaxID=5076 RepID=UPI0024DF0BDA|nr:uncharacterized protein N7489_005260 [Penicillium chrysogenum]KAJ5245164.1 hypothetical protein N7489_005260 [Penicillium chrysogenum]